MTWYSVIVGSIAVFGLFGAVGCGDPGAPSVSGKLSLGASVRASDFSSLQIRIFPESGSTFDPSRVAAEPMNSATVMVTSDTFPFHYRVGGGIGTTEQKTWRLVAWLSANVSEQPAPGDVFGSTLFSVHSCGAYGGYCGETSGVDCTLDEVIP